MSGIDYHKYFDDVDIMRRGIVLLVNDNVVQSSFFVREECAEQAPQMQ